MSSAPRVYLQVCVARRHRSGLKISSGRYDALHRAWVVPQPPAAPPLTLACNALSYTAEKWAELERCGIERSTCGSRGAASGCVGQMVRVGWDRCRLYTSAAVARGEGTRNEMETAVSDSQTCGPRVAQHLCLGRTAAHVGICVRRSVVCGVAAWVCPRRSPRTQTERGKRAANG